MVVGHGWVNYGSPEESLANAVEKCKYLYRRIRACESCLRFNDEKPDANLNQFNETGINDKRAHKMGK